MIRRRLTLKRVDPWSVLKFGFVVNIAFMLVAMLGFWILWIVVGRLGLIDQFCDSVGTIVLDLQECSLNGGNIFRTLLFLGLLGVVVQTGIMVFGAFLYNLIADLTGGLGFTFLDESGDTVRESRTTGETTTAARAATGRETSDSRTGAAAGASASSARTGSGTPPSGDAPRSASARPGGPPDQSSAPREPTPDGPPPAPGPGSGSETSSTPSSPSESAPPRSDRPGSSGGSSLWGDPTRSNDRT